MRRTAASLLLAASAALTLAGLAGPAAAVCGDGQYTWEACHCPDRIYFGGKYYTTGINC